MEEEGQPQGHAARICAVTLRLRPALHGMQPLVLCRTSPTVQPHPVCACPTQSCYESWFQDRNAMQVCEEP